MITYLNPITDPYYNLAWEEYIFKNIPSDEDILLLWQNDPSVIIGRNQNIFEEVNLEYTRKNHLPVIRRISGGGTVYHDLGNINFSIITNHYRDTLSNYKYFTDIIIQALKGLGLNALFHGKSDIYIDDYKISGNAQSYHQNRMLHHGTLLFSSDLTVLNQVIKGETFHMQSIGVKSKRAQVKCIRDFIKEPMNVEAFKQYLLSQWIKNEDLFSKVKFLTDKDYQAIEKLKTTKYNQWEWNYGESPAFEIKKQIDNYSYKITVEGGLISKVLVLFDKTEIQLHHFTGKRFDKTAFTDSIQFINPKYHQSLQALADLIFF